jgi:hypothetical protein
MDIGFYSIHVFIVLCHFVNAVRNLFAKLVIALRMNVYVAGASLVHLAISKMNNQGNNNKKNDSATQELAKLSSA